MVTIKPVSLFAQADDEVSVFEAITLLQSLGYHVFKEPPNVTVITGAATVKLAGVERSYALVAGDTLNIGGFLSIK